MFTVVIDDSAIYLLECTQCLIVLLSMVKKMYSMAIDDSAISLLKCTHCLWMHALRSNAQ